MFEIDSKRRHKRFQIIKLKLCWNTWKNNVKNYALAKKVFERRLLRVFIRKWMDRLEDLNMMNQSTQRISFKFWRKTLERKNKRKQDIVFSDGARASRLLLYYLEQWRESWRGREQGKLDCGNFIQV